MGVCECMRERKRERDRESEKETNTEIQRERQRCLLSSDKVIKAYKCIILIYRYYTCIYSI